MTPGEPDRAYMPDRVLRCAYCMDDILEPMFWNKYFKPSIIVMLLVVGLHWVASLEGLYWSIDWYDILMHFLGGLWTALFMLWAVSTQYGTKLKWLKSIIGTLSFVFIVGVLWEVHEIVLGFTDFSDYGYWFDTRLDLVMDMLGAICAVLVYRKDLKNN